MWPVALRIEGLCSPHVSLLTIQTPDSKMSLLVAGRRRAMTPSRLLHDAAATSQSSCRRVLLRSFPSEDQFSGCCVPLEMLCHASKGGAPSAGSKLMSGAMAAGGQVLQQGRRLLPAYGQPLPQQVRQDEDVRYLRPVYGMQQHFCTLPSSLMLDVVQLAAQR